MPESFKLYKQIRLLSFVNNSGLLEITILILSDKHLVSFLFGSEKNVLSRYNEITEYCNFSGGITELVKIILDFTNSGEFSLNLSSYGIVEGNFDDIIDGALTDVGARYNPVDLDKNDLREILLKTL